MQSVVASRLAGLGMAVVFTLLTAGGAVAVFAAGGPGDDVSPTAGAERLIDLTQSQESILWTALGPGVSMIKALGWPSSDGVNELGGALVIERPSDPLAGVINIGEKPASVEFTLDE
jgi:hypothetical protein